MKFSMNAWKLFRENGSKLRHHELLKERKATVQTFNTLRYHLMLYKIHAALHHVALSQFLRKAFQHFVKKSQRQSPSSPARKKILKIQRKTALQINPSPTSSTSRPGVMTRTRKVSG